MSRRRELSWNEPPPGALEWLRLCFESTKEAAVRLEREAFERDSQRYGADYAHQLWREDRRATRLSLMLITLMLRLPDAEQEEMCAWWGEHSEEGAEPPKPPSKEAEPAKAVKP